MDRVGPIFVIAHEDAGRGHFRRAAAGLKEILGPGDRYEPTRHAGHAFELARRAADDGWPAIGAAGGDGTAHEVASGILDSGRDPTLAVFPLGSANDYAVALGLAPGWWSKPGAGFVVQRLDVGRVRGQGFAQWFINGAGVGFNGQVTVESRKIKCLRGLMLYGLAVWRALRIPRSGGPWTVEVDGNFHAPRPLMTVSVALGHREGNFTLAPSAKLDDGLFDVIEAGQLTALEVLGLLPRLALGGKVTHPKVWQGQAKTVRVVADCPVAAHADGEIQCEAKDGVCEFYFELLPQKLAVMTGPGFRGGQDVSGRYS